MAAIGAKTSKIEVGTGLIDMRYENPYMMAENAGLTDIITQSRGNWVWAVVHQNKF